MDVDNADAALLALVENTAREEMRPFDEAGAARVLIAEYGFTQEHVARAIGASQGTVSRWLAVFTLNRRVVAALRKGRSKCAPRGRCYPCATRRARTEFDERILREGLSAGQVAALASARTHGPVRSNRCATRSGALRVKLEADDRDGLLKFLNSLRKKL